MFRVLLQEYRTHRWARFLVRLIVLGIILWVAKHVFGWSSGLLWVFFEIAAAVIAAYYLTRLIGFARNRLLWRLSRRLIVTYVFIAFVPIILILLLVGLGAYILNGQFAAYLVNARLRDHVDELEQVNRVVAHEATYIRSQNPKQIFDALENLYVSDLKQYSDSYPGLEITLRLGREARGFRLNGEPMLQPISEPRWLDQEEWSGIVMDRAEIFLSAVNRQEIAAGRLTLILSMPLTSDLLNMVGQGIGPVVVVPLESVHPAGAKTHAASLRMPRFKPKEITPPPEQIEIFGEETLTGYRVQSNHIFLPGPQMWLDFAVHGASAINPVIWRAPTFRERRVPILVVASSRIFPLNQQLLSILGEFSGFWVTAFIVIGIVFLIIEIIALLIGILLTRSITSTVDRLELATERVRSGDFSHRIGMPARDQVSALGTAFDTMTTSVQRLMEESREKLRLENELRIAHEVQQQLFPRTAPLLAGTTMFGECRPARGVSGDFYDFLKLGRERVGLVLGDVSGKGIYAALLMAGMQSAVRAQLYDGCSADSSQLFSTAGVLDRLNRQVYENTPDGKYATFFYAIYDALTRTLLYTNAGHPAPFLFRRNSLARLETGGTVIGLFPSTQYSQEQIRLEPGDVLLAFSDGLVEPENSYGEEFGDERLAQAVREAIDSPPEVLAREVYNEVMSWSASAEPSDDMTMLYLKTER